MWRDWVECLSWCSPTRPLRGEWLNSSKSIAPLCGAHEEQEQKDEADDDHTDGEDGVDEIIVQSIQLSTDESDEYIRSTRVACSLSLRILSIFFIFSCGMLCSLSLLIIICELLQLQVVQETTSQLLLWKVFRISVVSMVHLLWHVKAPKDEAYIGRMYGGWTSEIFYSPLTVTVKEWEGHGQGEGDTRE